jgi:hypothetical protein
MFTKISPFNTAASVSSLISRFGGFASFSPAACFLSYSC